jgi:hypothetical protein
VCFSFSSSRVRRVSGDEMYPGAAFTSRRTTERRRSSWTTQSLFQWTDGALNAGARLPSLYSYPDEFCDSTEVMPVLALCVGDLPVLREWSGYGHFPPNYSFQSQSGHPYPPPYDRPYIGAPRMEPAEVGALYSYPDEFCDSTEVMPVLALCVGDLPVLRPNYSFQSQSGHPYPPPYDRPYIGAPRMEEVKGGFVGRPSFSRVAMGRTWSTHKPTLDFFHTWCPNVGTIVGSDSGKRHLDIYDVESSLNEVWIFLFLPFLRMA